MNHNGKGIFEGCPAYEGCKIPFIIFKADTVPNCLEVTATAEGEIMAIKHKEYDVVGLQFHPESINTPDGMKLIENFVGGKF